MKMNWSWYWCLFYYEPKEHDYAVHYDWTWVVCKFFLWKLKRDGFKNAFMMSQKEAKKKYPYIKFK